MPNKAYGIKLVRLHGATLGLCLLVVAITHWQYSWVLVFYPFSSFSSIHKSWTAALLVLQTRRKRLFKKPVLVISLIVQVFSDTQSICSAQASKKSCIPAWMLVPLSQQIPSSGWARVSLSLAALHHTCQCKPFRVNLQDGVKVWQSTSPCYYTVESIQTSLATWLCVQLTRQILCMGSIEAIPDAGDIHVTSVQVFIVRDSYIAKPPSEWGGQRGGDLKG